MRLFLENKKYSFMIIFFILLFFCFDKCDALVLKNSQDIPFNTNSYHGTLTSNGLNYVAEGRFTNAINSNDYPYDFIGFKLNRLNFVSTNYLDIANPNLNPVQSYTFQCTNGGSYCNNAIINPTSSSVPQNLLGTIDSGDITISVNMYGTPNTSPCFFDSSLSDNMFVCPLYKDSTFTHLQFVITVNGYENIDYYIDWSVIKYFYNYDSTEIVNALSSVQQQQVNTVTTIENFNNYVSNTNTTQSQTQSTTALGGLTTTFNTHLSQMNELTRLAFMPINFIVDIADSTCQPLVWDIPFVNNRVIVPCMSSIYNGYFSVVVGVFSTVMTSLITYRCCLKLFNTIKGVLDAEDDKIEVVDL